MKDCPLASRRSSVVYCMDTSEVCDVGMAHSTHAIRCRPDTFGILQGIVTTTILQIEGPMPRD